MSGMLDMEITVLDAGVQHLITELLNYSKFYSAYLRQVMHLHGNKRDCFGSIRLFSPGINLYLSLHCASRWTLNLVMSSTGA